MSWSKRRARAVFASFLVASSAVPIVAAPASAEVGYFPHLTGDQEVPGPGDPDAVGVAKITIVLEDHFLCVEWDLANLDQATSAHIHAGEAGGLGPIVVTLPTPDADGLGGGCVFGVSHELITQITSAPHAYYVDVHTSSFENGAIRGQLGEAIPFFSLSVTVFACPEGTQVTAGLDFPEDEGCAIVLRPDEVPPLQDGHSWAVEPIAIDLDLEVDDGAHVLTIADADVFADAPCGPALCHLSGSHKWEDVFAGDTVITQLAVPDGYELISAIVYDGPSHELVEANNSSVVVDSTLTARQGHVSHLNIVLYDVAAPAEPEPTLTPSPAPSAGEAPAATETPTVPPTSTATTTNDSGAIIVAPFLVVTLVAFASMLAVMRGAPRRR
jgi:hypothetical protein